MRAPKLTPKFARLLPRTSLCFVCAFLLGAMALSLFARLSVLGSA